MLAGSPEEEDGVADVDDISWSVSRLGADGGSEKHAVVRRQTAVANASRGVTSKRIPRKLEASAQGRRAKGDRSSAHRGLSDSSVRVPRRQLRIGTLPLASCRPLKTRTRLRTAVNC